MRFVMNAGRTSKQGQQINVGKDHDEYKAMVSTLTLHPEDLKALGGRLLDVSTADPATEVVRSILLAVAEARR